MLGLGHGVQSDTVGLAEIYANRYSLAFNGTDEYVEINAAGNAAGATATGISGREHGMTAATPLHACYG